MDQFETFPCIKTCVKCKYVLDHENKYEYDQDHFTCLCFLLSERSICCRQGFVNLITTVPGMKHILIVSNFRFIPSNLNRNHLINNYYEKLPNNTSWREAIKTFCSMYLLDSLLFNKSYFKSVIEEMK